MVVKQENGDPENILPPIEQVIRFFDLQGNDLALDVEKGCLECDHSTLLLLDDHHKHYLLHMFVKGNRNDSGWFLFAGIVSRVGYESKEVS